MNEDIQARIDEFAQRLGALNVEFEELKREAARRGAPTPVPPVVETVQPVATTELPSWLRAVDELFEAGADRKALKEAERVRAWALGIGSAAILTELLAYLETVESADSSLPRVRYAVRQSLAFASGGGASAPQAPPAAAHRTAQAPPRELHVPRPAFEIDLLGPRALAIAGGIVTLLGIVFFFVLAVNRGWIGPDARVALGGIAAAIVFAAGLELKRRYGTTYSTLAAIGAGIAGSYATLLSAAALYHMLSSWEALLAAGAIAAAGLVTAVVWRSEIVAGIGLLGALLVPGVIEAQGGLSVLATSFVAIVFAVLAAVCLRLDWPKLLVAGGIGSVPQILALAFSTQYFDLQSTTGPITLVAVFFVLYVATGCVRQLRVASTSLDPVAVPFVIVAGLMAGGSLARLVHTNEHRGVAMLILAGAYVVPAAFFFTRERTRDLGALLAFATFTLVAVGTALLLHGDGLAYAWAAEAAGLAWLSRTVREIRFQLWSGVYLVLALIHSLFDAPPRHLDYPGLTPDAVTAHPAAGVGTIVAVAAASAAFSFYARQWSDDELPAGERLLADSYKGFAASHRALRLGTAWLTLVLSTYAASLGVLAVFSSSSTYGDDMVRGFIWGTVANAVIWMAVGLVLLAFGFRRDLEHLRLGALVWLGLTGLLALVQASRFLVDNPRTVAVAVVGVAALITSFVYGMSRHEGVDRPTLISVPVALLSVSLLVYPTGYRLEERWAGAALLGLAAVYAVLSGMLGRRQARNPSTAYWAIAIALAIFGDGLLLDGTFAVLGWAALGVAVAWLGGRVRERRLYVGSGTLVALSVTWAFAIQAPPTHLFATRLHPAYGTASIFIAALAVAGLAVFARSELGRLRTAPWWLAGGLAVYGVSILILELVERISSTGLHTEFQRGQTAVSAFWGLLGLALLYTGLKRRRRMLRVAGLAFFPISLAKIFLFDLPALSSVTRALSFLAVGAVLLLGGFFYQRLMSTRDESPPSVPAA